MLSCTNNQTGQISNSPENRNKIISVDLNKEYPQKNIIIQDVANVEYIPLETNNNALFKYLSIGAISNNHIIIYNKSNGSIFIFDRKGNFLNTFNRQGGGGEEYNYIFSFCFDDKKEEIYIVNLKKQCNIYIYSLTGKFKRKISLPENIWTENIINYDDNYLFCYDCFNLDNPDPKLKTNIKPYFFVSKETGKITPLMYETKNRISNSILMVAQKKVISVNMNPIIKNGSATYISDFGSDTIYSLKSKTLTPIITKHPTVKENNPPILLSIQLLSDRFILMRSIKKQFENSNIETKNFGYDNIEKKIYTLNFLNADLESKKGIKIDNITASPHNIAQWGFQANTLVEYNKKGLLKGKLKEIASKLSPDDNPVLMLIDFNK